MGNFITKSLMNKLIVLFLLVGLVPIAIVGYMSYSSGRAALEERVLDKMEAISESRERHIQTLLRLRMEEIDILAANEIVQTIVESWNKKEKGETVDVVNLQKEADNFIETELPEFSQITPFFEYTFIGETGKVYFSTDKSIIGDDLSQDEIFKRGLKEKFSTDLAIDKKTGKQFYAVVVPLFPHEAAHKNAMGIIIAKTETIVLNEITTNLTGLGETGEVYIVNKDGYMITESRFEKDVILKQKNNSKPVQLFQSKKELMQGIYSSYRNMQVVGASDGEHIEEEFGLGWTILTEINVNEAFAPIKALGSKITGIAIIIALIITFIAYFVAKSIANPIKNIASLTQKVASGDLTVSIQSKSEDEVGNMAKAFQTMIVTLRNMVAQILSTADRISSSSQELSSSAQEMNATAEEVSSTVQQIAKGTETQAERVEETQKVMEQMSASVTQVSKGAQDSAAQASGAAETAQAGGVSAKDAQEKMTQISDVVINSASSVKKLGERSDQIGEIVGVITNIADQTNLLALNAAIEAARAGEYGRGFAVVAEEVRKLAEGSAKAADEISKLIKDVQRETQQAVFNIEGASKETGAVKNIAEKVGVGLQDIVKNAENVATMIE
ncbi:MAG: methyl-accepting chemotaxis protein [Candidatus Omnitrophota bacterium]|nr:methyl-accepting chemotaxis protein [Candidatus Omnitrophota bacterium]